MRRPPSLYGARDTLMSAICELKTTSNALLFLAGLLAFALALRGAAKGELLGSSLYDRRDDNRNGDGFRFWFIVAIVCYVGTMLIAKACGWEDFYCYLNRHCVPK